MPTSEKICLEFLTIFNDIYNTIYLSRSYKLIKANFFFIYYCLKNLFKIKFQWFLFKFPFPYIKSELLFPIKIGKVRGTSSSNLPRSVDACVLQNCVKYT